MVDQPENLQIIVNCRRTLRDLYLEILRKRRLIAYLRAKIRPRSAVYGIYTPSKAKIDSVFEVIATHSAPRSSVELLSLPEIFHLFYEEEGRDYWKVFVDNMLYREGHGQSYENYVWY